MSKQVGIYVPLVLPEFIHSEGWYLWYVSVSMPGISRSYPIYLFSAASELGITNPDEEIEAKGGEVEGMRKNA